MTDRTITTLPYSPAEARRQLHRVLSEVRDLNLPFDMDTYAADPRDCRSAACALGWAARDSWFNHHGVRLGRDPVIPGAYYVQIGDDPSPFGYGDAEEFFGLERGAGSRLFSSIWYDFEDEHEPTASDVIARLEEIDPSLVQGA